MPCLGIPLHPPAYCAPTDWSRCCFGCVSLPRSTMDDGAYYHLEAAASLLFVVITASFLISYALAGLSLSRNPQTAAAPCDAGESASTGGEHAAEPQHDETLRRRGMGTGPESVGGQQVLVTVRLGEECRTATFARPVQVEAVLSTLLEAEVQSGRRVRLVYNGRVHGASDCLDVPPDTAEATLHAVLSRAASAPPAASPAQDQPPTPLQPPLRPGTVLMLVIIAFLCIVWAMIFFSPQLVNTSSRVLLGLLTLAVLAFRPRTWAP